jgi:lipopolysaccharide/colanic/teichoic acid biosynthesis glycosyltransferase
LEHGWLRLKKTLVAGRYSTSPECKLMYDLLYTRSYSPARDIAILFQTVKVILIKDRAS